MSSESRESSRNEMAEEIRRRHQAQRCRSAVQTVLFVLALLLVLGVVVVVPYLVA